MRKLIKILAIVGAVVLLGLGGVIYFTAGMVDTAEKFFTCLRDDQYQQAYGLLSRDFKATTSMDELKAYVAKNGMNDYRAASWDNRSINGSRGTLTGSITTESGEVIPVTLNFVKGESGWKIYSLEKPSSGLLDESNNHTIPDEKEQVRLVAKSMHEFAESVNQKSMQQFHQYISNLWRSQFSVKQLDDAYGSLYASGTDLTVLDRLSPQFTQKASIDENGVLLLQGVYPTRPSKVSFSQKYIYEGFGWKLMGFNINIK